MLSTSNAYERLMKPCVVIPAGQSASLRSMSCPSVQKTRKASTLRPFMNSSMVSTFAPNFRVFSDAKATAALIAANGGESFSIYTNTNNFHGRLYTPGGVHVQVTPQAVIHTKSSRCSCKLGLPMGSPQL